jgi:hypothetical protein
MRACGVVLLLAVLALAAPARAADVRVDSWCDSSGSDCGQTAVFRAAAGERNDLTVTVEGAVALFRDAGAPVTASGLCVAVDPHAARCAALPADETLSTYADLGDGDDLALDPVGILDGGPGDDRLTGGMFLTGGPGADVLTADADGTRFFDGDGRDPAPDRYIGGAGQDDLYYDDRREGVTVDLRSGRAGAPGEGDVATDVDLAGGGTGNDVLIGTDAADTLIGDAGSDRLVGRGGNDRLVTGEDLGDGELERGARDVVRAGAGRDLIESTSDHGDRGDRIDPGPGRDFVDLARRRDLLAGCEALTLGDAVHDGVVRLRETLPRPGAAFLVDRGCRCIGERYAARAHGQAVARARGRKRRVALRLNPLGRRLLETRRRLPVTVRFRERFPDGTVFVAGFRAVLRLRPPAPAAGSSCPACRRAGRR